MDRNAGGEAVLVGAVGPQVGGGVDIINDPTGVVLHQLLLLLFTQQFLQNCTFRVKKMLLKYQ